MPNGVLLADIGNTHFHTYDGKSVEHLSYSDAIAKYQRRRLCYISVKQQLKHRISDISLWQDISSKVWLNGAYTTMGVDRKVLCLSREEGVFVDAGSAITVDVMAAGVYQGGYIFPGIKAMLESYKTISLALDTPLNPTISLEQLPCTTKDGISYGIIASIKALIETHRKSKPLYFTGGDGQFLSSYFSDSVYDELLIFDGMRKVIKEQNIC